jgi:hypothetical protein
MSQTITVSATGTSPLFSITKQDFLLRKYLAPSSVSGNFVPPPSAGPDGGFSIAMNLTNSWFPWIDEKLCEPKYDGVCQYLGVTSNRPTYVKDYHMIALNRAADYILAPVYKAFIQVSVTSPAPTPPPTVGS